MPRRVQTRTWYGNRRESEAWLDAILEYLLTGDLRHACREIRACSAPAGTLLLLWRQDKLAEFWREHRDTIRSEAKRRRIKAHGEIYERWADGGARFVPDMRPEDPAA